MFRNARYHEQPPPTYIWRWLDHCIHRLQSDSINEQLTETNIEYPDIKRSGLNPLHTSLQESQQHTRLASPIIRRKVSISEIPEDENEDEEDNLMGSPTHSWQKLKRRLQAKRSSKPANAGPNAINVGSEGIGANKGQAEKHGLDDSNIRDGEPKYLLDGVTASFSPGSLNAIISDSAVGSYFAFD